jgi:hypothetical protein
MVVVVVVMMMMISKQDRHTHKSMNTHKTQIKAVTLANGSAVHPSGWTPHEKKKKYQNFLPR